MGSRAACDYTMAMSTLESINPDLVRRAREIARSQHQSLEQVIERALADYVAERESAPKPPILKDLPVAGDPKRQVTHEELKAAIQDMELARDLKNIGRSA